MTNMGRSIERLEQQFTDLPDIGYLQANNLSLKMTAVSPIELTTSACEKISVLSDRTNQFVNIKLGDNVPDVQTHHDRLEQEIVYLLSSLMRVTPVGETLTAINETGSDELHLAIQGGGRQVSFDERERLFEPFFRLRGEGERGNVSHSLAPSGKRC